MRALRRQVFRGGNLAYHLGMQPNLVSSRADRRRGRALSWLRRRSPGEEVLLVAASAGAAVDLLREAVPESSALLGCHRVSLDRLAAELSLEARLDSGAVPVTGIAIEAVARRVVHTAAGDLGRFAAVAAGPGFPAALASVVTELRLVGIDDHVVVDRFPEIGALARRFAEELESAGLVDRARILEMARERIEDPAPHPLLDLPLLGLDLPLVTRAEGELLRALAARAPEALLTVPAGDDRTRKWLGGATENLDGSEEPASTLERIQRYLFGETPGPGETGDDLVLLSAPGENRECVEVVRRVVESAEAGIPFDRMAVLLRSPETYRPHLEEACFRAGVPIHLARGTRRPDPAGRAFLALLACAEEGLSARRFAEYLSLGEVPAAEPVSGTATPAGDRWVAPDTAMIPAPLAAWFAARGEVGETGNGLPAAPPDPESPVVAGTLRAPRRWERLLVDASVIGGLDRWRRRLDGREAELRRDTAALEDADDPMRERIERERTDLAALREFALPVLERLDTLPGEASWGIWRQALADLAAASLRHPDRVLSVLSELTPMDAIGPARMGDVRILLEPRLLTLTVPPSGPRYGALFVGTPEDARGMVFDDVFVPGMAERLFPRKIVEDPLLLDAERAAIPSLPRNPDRVQAERLALRIAVGAARHKLVLSYPRLDSEQSRPRVPSFYMLEVLRAAEGRLHDFQELTRRAETTSEARAGWPAPPRAEEAIDDAEFDLAVLHDVERLAGPESEGAAHFLLGSNPNLARALRARAQRWWLSGWTPADGLVDPSDDGREALERHQLSARSFSPTALQNFSLCPYRFFLYTLVRLQPREERVAIETLDPLTRGSMVHEIQFRLFGRLRDAGLLPVRPGNLETARGVLEEELEAVAASTADELAPAIDGVWKEGIAGIRADLREWLWRMAEDDSGWVPWRFELSFGLPLGEGHDPNSVEEPASLPIGIRLRGSIDLVEQRGDEAIRATDHKTGKERLKHEQITAGGTILQPVLYALAAETLLPGARVESGRLYYCTESGGFVDRTVSLDAAAREAAGTVAEVVGGALEEGFLPAAPARDACRWCDYQPVCGTQEEIRLRRKMRNRKSRDRLAGLQRLRDLP